MQLPNKLYSYDKSTLSLIPIVLKEIKNKRTNAVELFYSIKDKLDSPTDFLAVMDCLYALNAINMNEKGDLEICL